MWFLEAACRWSYSCIKLTVRQCCRMERERGLWYSFDGIWFWCFLCNSIVLMEMHLIEAPDLFGKYLSMMICYRFVFCLHCFQDFYWVTVKNTYTAVWGHMMSKISEKLFRTPSQVRHLLLISNNKLLLMVFQKSGKVANSVLLSSKEYRSV